MTKPSRSSRARFTPLLFAALSIAVTSVPATAGLYDAEINQVRSRVQEFVAHADTTWIRFEKFRIAWESLDFYLGSIEKQVLERATSSPLTPDPELQALKDLADERAWIDSTLALLDSLEEPIKRRLDDSWNAARGYDALEQLHRIHASETQNELGRLRADLERRKNAATKAFEVWLVWQQELAAAAMAQDRQEMLEALDVTEGLWDADQALRSLRIDFFAAIQRGDTAEAQSLYDAYVWFRGQLPVYFADKITTPLQTDQIRVLLEDSEKRQSKMSAALGSATEPLLRQAETVEATEPTRESHAKSSSKGSGKLDNMEEIKRTAADMKPGTSVEHHEKRQIEVNGERATVSMDVRVTKSVAKYELDGSAYSDVTARAEGTVRFEGDRAAESVGSPGGAELSR